MRIGVDIKAFKNGASGIARYLRSILDVLQKVDQENDYTLFSCARSDYALVNSRWKKSCTPWRLPGVLWQQFVLPRLLENERIDVLWAPEQVCPVFGAGRVKMITTVYDFTFLRYPATCQWSNRWIQRFLFPASISRSAVLAPISDFIGREIKAFYPSKASRVSIVPVYCSGPGWTLPDSYSPEKRGDFLFFPGNLEPRKNLVSLIRALELLRSTEGLVVPLRLAGPAGWKNGAFHSLIAQSTVKESVRSLGFVSEDELRRQYLSCKALIYPSLYEGFGMPVLEALSLDCPALTSAGTVMQEIAGDTALFFDPQSVESIAAAIKTVYEPSFDRKLLLKNAAAVAGRYSWEKSAYALLKILNSR